MTLSKISWSQILKDLLSHILPTLEVQEPGRLKKQETNRKVRAALCAEKVT